MEFLLLRCFLSTKQAGSFNQHTTFIRHIYSLWHLLLFSKHCWIITFLPKSFLLWLYLSDWLQLVKKILSLPLLAMYGIHIKDRMWLNLLLSHRYLYISWFSTFKLRERGRKHISAHMTSACALGCQEMQVFVKTEQLYKVLLYMIKVLQIL